MYLSFRVSCHMVISCRILSWIRIARARVQVPVQDVLPSGDGEDLLLMRFLSTACAPRLYSKAPTCTSRVCVGARPRRGSCGSAYADIHGALLRGAMCDQKGLRDATAGDRCVLCRACGSIPREPGLAIRMSHLVDGDYRRLGALDGTIYAQTLPSLALLMLAAAGRARAGHVRSAGLEATHVATNFLRDAAGSLLVTCERNYGKLSRMARLCTETFGLSCVQPTRADTTKLEEAAEAGTELAAAVVAHCGERVRE